MCQHHCIYYLHGSFEVYLYPLMECMERFKDENFMDSEVTASPHNLVAISAISQIVRGETVSQFCESIGS